MYIQILLNLFGVTPFQTAFLAGPLPLILKGVLYLGCYPGKLGIAMKYFASINENGRFLDYLNNDNYVIFCNVPPAYEGVPDPSLIPFINAIGLSEEKLKDYGAFVLNRGQIVYESHDYDFKAGINDGNRRMLFYRTTDKDSGYMETFVRTNGSMGFQKVTDYEKYTMPQDGLGFYVYDTVLDRAICGYTVH